MGWWDEWDGGMSGMVGWWDEWDGREQKVGSAEKKLRLTQKMAHRVYQGGHVGELQCQPCIIRLQVGCFKTPKSPSKKLIYSTLHLI